MKSDIIQLENNTDVLEKILEETEKASKYEGLNTKQIIRERLLAEELINMLPELLEYCNGNFWVTTEGKKISLHISVTLDDIFSADREKLMELSTSKTNASAKGIVNKIRAACEMMLMDYVSLSADVPTDFYSMGMMGEPFNYYISSWSLDMYRQALEKEDDELAWDELEKSIIANIADDVIVGIIGKNVDIIVVKDWEDKA
ncbi:MAG: hypothetical protein IJS61_02750 [Firmicutes bacterium]|nr:hypothetical protein [Bacillota bacterium]